MIDSVSKDTVCVVQELAVLFQNKELMGAAMKFAQARLSPPTFAQVASEAALIHLKVILTRISEYRAEIHL
jgi:aspartate aminotransferase